MESMWVSLLGTQQGKVDLEQQTKGLSLRSCAISSIIQVFNIYSFLRNRAPVGVGQREGETQNPKQAPGSELSAQSPTRGSNSRTARS